MPGRTKYNTSWESDYDQVKSFLAKQKKVAEQAKEVDDEIELIRERMQSAKRLVDEGSKLLKAYVTNMNRGIFLDGQGKVETGQKRKKELDEDLKKAIKRKKILIKNQQT